MTTPTVTIWEDVIDFPNYIISDKGEVFSVYKKGYKSILTDRGGYQYVLLWKNNKQTHHLIHRLVLTAFVGLCPVGMEACHLDGNKSNNYLNNLKWATKKENESHKIRHGTHNKGSRHNMAKLTEDDVLKIKELCGLGKIQSIVAKQFDVSQATIGMIMSGRTWKHV